MFITEKEENYVQNAVRELHSNNDITQYYSSLEDILRTAISLRPEVEHVSREISNEKTYIHWKDGSKDIVDFSSLTRDLEW